MNASDLTIFDAGKTLKVDKKLHLIRAVDSRRSYVAVTVLQAGRVKTLTLAPAHEVELQP
ncbi:hypothetical protein ACWEQ4_00900 [Rhodococcus sp. NPDC003994]